MAGGMGKRLKPVSGDTPKPMTPLCGRPVMEYVLLLLKKHGIDEVCATLKYRPDNIMSYFGDGSSIGMKLSYRVENEALGTAGSVKNCSDFYGDEPFLVISGDAICDFDLTALIAEHTKQSPCVSLALYPHSLPLRYGLALCGEEGFVRRFVEKPDWKHVMTNLVNTGIYVVSPEAMALVPEDRAFDFAGDLFPLLLDRGEKLLGVPMSGYWCDIGTPLSYYRCCVDALEGRIELPLRCDFAPDKCDDEADEPGGESCPCSDRARLMDLLSRSFMDLGGDFSDGLCIELGGEKLSIAPMVGSSALKICCRSGDSETSRELVSSLKKLCSDAEKRLVSEGK